MNSIELEKSIVESPSHGKVLIPTLDFKSLRTIGSNKSSSKPSTPNSAVSGQNSATTKPQISIANNNNSDVPEQKKFDIGQDEEMILKAKRAASPRLLSQKVSLSSKIQPLPKTLKRPSTTALPISPTKKVSTPSSTTTATADKSTADSKSSTSFEPAARSASPTTDKNLKNSTQSIADNSPLKEPVLAITQKSPATPSSKPNLTIADISSVPPQQVQQFDGRLSQSSLLSLSSTTNSQMSTTSSIKKAIASYINIHPDKSLQELVHMTKPTVKKEAAFTSGRSSASLKYDPGYVSPKLKKVSAAFAPGLARFPEDRSTCSTTPPPGKYDPYPELAISHTMTGNSVISNASNSFHNQNPNNMSAAFRSTSPRLPPARCDSPTHSYQRDSTPHIIDLKKQLEDKKKSKKDYLKAILGKDIDQVSPSASFANAPRFDNSKNCLSSDKFLSVKGNISKLLHEKDIVRRKTFSIYDKELTPGPGSYYQPTLPDSIYQPSK